MKSFFYIDVYCVSTSCYKDKVNP